MNFSCEGEGDETVATAITTAATVSQDSPKANPQFPCFDTLGMNEPNPPQVCLPLHLPDKFCQIDRGDEHRRTHRKHAPAYLNLNPIRVDWLAERLRGDW